MLNASQRLLAKQWLKRKARERKTESNDLATSKIDGAKNPEEDANSLIYCASDNQENSLFLRLNHRKFEKIEVILFLALGDGRTYVLPNHPDVTSDKISSDEWSIGDLKLKILEKYRRVRVTYNGFMRLEKEIEHVRFNFIFIAQTKPRLRKDYWDLELASETLTKSGGNSTNWQRLWNSLRIDSADQWGSMVGQVFTEDGKIADLFLHGFRCQLYDAFDQNIELKKSICLTGFTAKGMNFHIIVNDYDNGPQKICLGHVKDGNDNFCNVKKIQLNELAELDLVNPSNDQFLIQFTTSERDFQVNLKLIKESRLKLNNLEFQYCRLALEFSNCFGSGFIEIWKPKPRNVLPSLKNELTIRPTIVNLDSLILRFGDELCKTEELVGGKGSSLAKLSSLKSNQFAVPKGFCITVNAFKEHVKENKSIQDGINELFSTCANLEREKIRTLCQRLELLFKGSTLSKKLEEIILKELVTGKRYAVRSSAVGEDGTESSAAGQNATFLGICDIDELKISVVKCWGSLFGYRSVEYRRQQGLPIKSAMGICIQEMVDSDSAGVMFTRHPSTGNPKEMIITSNYGLGETVVSALVEPDTIIVSRNWQDVLQIEQVNIGSKGKTLRMDSSQGIVTAEISEADNKIQSISDSHAIELAKIGLYLEKVSDEPKDVEWAISGGDIHLLQCRPITSLNNFTEFELTHELGTGTANENDSYNFANLGEVFPYAMSPLTLSTMVKTLEALMEYFLTSKVNFDLYRRHLFIGYMRLQMNHIKLCKMASDNRKMLKLHDIAMIGRVVTTDEILELGKERHGPLKKMEMIKMMRTMSKGFFSSKKVVEKSKHLVTSCERKFTGNWSTRELYKKLGEHLMDVLASNKYHNMITCKSIMLQLMVMNIVTEGSEDITEKHFVDIAHLLKSCRDVISAGVPTIMRNIAMTIRQANLADKFNSVNSSKLDWLKNNCPKAHEKVKHFLSIYGHRAVMEWDLMTETWGMNPDKLLSTIQVLASADLEINDSSLEKPMDVNKIVDELTSLEKTHTKWLLRKFLPLCHKTLQRRELTKSLLMKVVHIFRTNYIRLETLMIREGLLPDDNLIFFLTYEEIGVLLDGKGAALVRKAIQRRRFYPKLRSYQFDEINVGMLTPIKVNEKIDTNDSSALIRGTAVCGSKISGRACVITQINDATEIRPGDILITKSTDIGWTPYFPILSGVVTEIGGIISHGSVVAREFNLPCIIGASNATKIFKTGDKVTMDGNTGVLKLA